MKFTLTNLGVARWCVGRATSAPTRCLTSRHRRRTRGRRRVRRGGRVRHRDEDHDQRHQCRESTEQPQHAPRSSLGRPRSRKPFPQHHTQADEDDRHDGRLPNHRHVISSKVADHHFDGRRGGTTRTPGASQLLPDLVEGIGEVSVGCAARQHRQQRGEGRYGTLDVGHHRHQPEQREHHDNNAGRREGGPPPRAETAGSQKCLP
jgi:hypothetical protein